MNSDDWTIRIGSLCILVSLLIAIVVISGCTETDRLLDEAKTAYNSGRYAEAVSLYNQAIQLSGSNSQLYYLKGQALFELVRYKDAIDAFTAAIRIQPDYPEAWFMKGRASYMMGDYDEAVRSFYKAIELDETNTEYWYYRGLALSARGQYDLAISHFDKVLQINPSVEKAWSSRGYAYVMEKNYTDALDSFEAALKINPDNAENWINKASVLRVLGRIDEADIAISQANLLYKKQEEVIARKIPKTPITVIPRPGRKTFHISLTTFRENCAFRHLECVSS